MTTTTVVNSSHAICGANASRWIDSSLSLRPSNGEPTGVPPLVAKSERGREREGRGRSSGESGQEKGEKVRAKRARFSSTEFV